MNKLNMLMQLDKRDETILLIVATFMPLIGFAGMLY
jgi:hypothetical protein